MRCSPTWRHTAPVLAGLLQQDPRLHVRVVQDPAILADPSIHQYDALVLHFVNWEVPSPGKAARENFKKYLTGGKGVVMIHFACGAWQDWPEFRDLVARVWDPKLRPHDPRGPFAVTITSSPIVAGLKSFEANDELYTCVAGERPIEVLAEARALARRCGLHYVYVGNVRELPDAETTFCPRCGKSVIERDCFFIRSMNLDAGKCKSCGAAIPGVWTA